MPVRFQFVPGKAPDLLDLPWSTPLEEWDHPRMVEMARGFSRHVVRFVSGGENDERVFALKEIPERYARREYNLLRFMQEEGLPTVEAVGVVTGRQRGAIGQREELSAILVTRYLDYSLPYGYVFSTYGLGEVPGTDTKLIDAAVVLLCRLHLDGFYWGDCSLNNLLFRRDAGALMAYLVDAETAEHHRELSPGMRQADVDLASEQAGGGLLDLAAAGRLPEWIDPIEVAHRISARYEALWSELTDVEEIGVDERHQLDRRIRRLNDLGFDVAELVVEHLPDDEARMRMWPALVEEGHHARELRRMTGLDVQENQARHLLNDIAAFGACLERTIGTDLPSAVTAARWIAEIYEPLLRAVPAELAGKRDAPELFHEMLEHRYAMSEREGREVTNPEALASLVQEVLPTRPDERLFVDVTPNDPDPGARLDRSGVVRPPS
jgi:hypothetical protein